MANTGGAQMQEKLKRGTNAFRAWIGITFPVLPIK